jgi:dolichol-phosphate mannosyltransferase
MGSVTDSIPLGLPGPSSATLPARLSIVIPTLNENGNVSRLINELERLLPAEPEIVVVDDNSSDGTVDSVLGLRRKFSRIHVIQRTARKGIGSAVREGIQYALEHTSCEYVVTMDADWSHDPHQLHDLLVAAREVDFVQGSRYVTGGMIRGWPPVRRLLSIVGNNACRILFRTGLREHTNFYRILKRDCAQLVVANVDDDGYAWGVRSLLEALDAGFTAREVPITFAERRNGESKLGVRQIAGWVISVAQLFASRRRS